MLELELFWIISISCLASKVMVVCDYLNQFFLICFLAYSSFTYSFKLKLWRTASSSKHLLLPVPEHYYEGSLGQSESVTCRHRRFWCSIYILIMSLLIFKRVLLLFAGKILAYAVTRLRLSRSVSDWNWHSAGLAAAFKAACGWRRHDRRHDHRVIIRAMCGRDFLLEVCRGRPAVLWLVWDGDWDEPESLRRVTPRPLRHLSIWGPAPSRVRVPGRRPGRAGDNSAPRQVAAAGTGIELTRELEFQIAKPPINFKLRTNQWPFPPREFRRLGRCGGDMGHSGWL